MCVTESLCVDHFTESVVTDEGLMKLGPKLPDEWKLTLSRRNTIRKAATLRQLSVTILDSIVVHEWLPQLPACLAADICIKVKLCTAFSATLEILDVWVHLLWILFLEIYFSAYSFQSGGVGLLLPSKGSYHLRCPLYLYRTSLCSLFLCPTFHFLTFQFLYLTPILFIVASVPVNLPIYSVPSFVLHFMPPLFLQLSSPCEIHNFTIVQVRCFVTHTRGKIGCFMTFHSCPNTWNRIVASRLI